MDQLCFITVCKGRLAHLQQTLPAAAAQPGCSCVVVDYSCPEHCGDWVERHYPKVKVVRALGQPSFHPAHARNVGAAQATADWLCFVDADVCVRPDFAENVLGLLQPGNFYRIDPPVRGLTGMVICRRSDFLQVGGYDETYVNWGEEDLDLYDHFLLSGLAQKGLPDKWVRQLAHGDNLRVEHFRVKAKEVSQTTNFLYRSAKYDLMRLLGRELAASERQELYAQAGQMVQMGLANSQSSQWRIPFRQSATMSGQDVQAALVYSLIPGQQKP